MGDLETHVHCTGNLEGVMNLGEGLLYYSLAVKFLPHILSIVDLQFVGYRHISLCTILASR